MGKSFELASCPGEAEAIVEWDGGALRCVCGCELKAGAGGEDPKESSLPGQVKKGLWFAKHLPEKELGPCALPSLIDIITITMINIAHTESSLCVRSVPGTRALFHFIFTIAVLILQMKKQRLCALSLLQSHS